VLHTKLTDRGTHCHPKGTDSPTAARSRAGLGGVIVRLRSRFELLPAGRLLINTARGSLVD